MMKHSKLITLLFCIINVLSSPKSFGQANPFVNVLPSNSGIVYVGTTVDIIVTIGNTGPVSAIPQAKLRPIIQVPPCVTFLPTAQQTGLPTGWTILTNSGSQIRVCNTSDPLPVNTIRTVVLKAIGVTVSPPQTFSANINFGNGTTCAPGPTVLGDLITDNSATSTVQVLPAVTLDLNLIIQGYWDISSMRSVLSNQGHSNPTSECDSITVELHDTVAPFALLHSKAAILNTNGTASLLLSPEVTPGHYYIAVKHRNSLETWSSAPVHIAPGSVYNFTSAANKAYGNNQVEVVSGVWAIYSGDIDQNGYVEIDDFNIWEINYITGFPFTNYTPDLDGNGYIEVDDFNIWDSNYLIGVFSFTP